jgi:predicted nucleotidyltransferase
MQNERHSSILQEISKELQAEVGDNFCSLYLVGSYGTKMQLRNSDVDLILVTNSPLNNNALENLWSLRTELRKRLKEKIDINPRAITDILARGMGVKYDGRLIGGRELRDQIRIPDKSERFQILLSAALIFLKRIHRAPEIESRSLRYPDQNDEFYGYLDFANDLPLHPLMSLTFLANARLAGQFGVFANTKHDIPNLYAENVHDGTEVFVEALYSLVRATWQYELPQDIEERRRLRSLCRDALEFEKASLMALGV